VYLDYLFLQKDTRTSCLEWIDANISSDKNIVLSSRIDGPPLSQTPEQILQKAEDAGLSDIQKKHVMLLAKAVRGRKNHNVYYWAERPAESAFTSLRPVLLPGSPDTKKIDYWVLGRAAKEDQDPAWKEVLASGTEKVVSFSPFRNPARQRPADALGVTAVPEDLHDLFTRTSLGPYLEVYRVKK
jgi:hypothetical protein